MDTLLDDPATLPSVRARVSYLVPMKDKPTTYAITPPPGVPHINSSYEMREVLIRNARTVRDSLSLEREGFRLVDHASAVKDFWDDDDIRTAYLVEAQELIQALTGARSTMAFDYTRRRRPPGGAPLSAARSTFNVVNEPVARVHTDFTQRSAPERVRRELGAKADDLLRRRFAILNLWRPLNPEPIHDAPLAVLDAGSISPADLVATDLVYADRIGEIYTGTHNPLHRWWYFPRQRRDEVIVFKNFDSDGPATFCPHTAFDDPTADARAPRRESIEVRVFAFF